MTNKYLKVILFFAFVIITEIIFAQGQSPNHRPPVPPGRVPIDGGIFGLLVLGVGYAIKKIHNQSKK
jgi:hypothetical protein